MDDTHGAAISALSGSTPAGPDPVGPAPSGEQPSTSDLPPGDHPLEVAARRGIGPLSPLGNETWHGQARPCVSCGAIVLRDQRECDHCGQDLSDEMLEKMRAHAGPWTVLEHLRPFPGVSLDRLVRQIRRGVLTETSIVRGPGTDYQWRFAVETPGLCKHFGRCWNCHEEVDANAITCASCLSGLEYLAPREVQRQPAQPHARGDAADTPPNPRQLRELSAVLGSTDVARRDAVWDEPPRIGRVKITWIAIALIVLLIAALMWITERREKGVSSPPPPDARGSADAWPMVPDGAPQLCWDHEGPQRA